MEHQESDKSKDPESAASGNVRIWATEHKALLISTVIGALGAIVAAIITITPTFLRQVADKEFDDDYVVNYSFYHILLDGFTPVADDQIEGKEKSVVRTVRIDSISKNSANKVDYMLPLYTTGKEIKYEANKSSIKAVFHEVKNVDETRKHSYELRFPIGGKPMGDTEVIKSSFKFINGFRNNKAFISNVRQPSLVNPCMSFAGRVFLKRRKFWIIQLFSQMTDYIFFGWEIQRNQTRE